MFALALCVASAAASGTSVLTRFGTVEGTLVGDGGAAVRQFLNIPYALPPTGALRFADPNDWSAPFAGGSFNATRVGVQCPQQGGGGGEDCLVLSVWSPQTKKRRGAAAALPVLVFVHGGNFVEGNGDQYNATLLAAKHGAVVVTLNYRLGHLGWLQPAPGSANFGLKDQRSALRWVRGNAGAFGGDAARVLLFGESAGAISVAGHLLSPSSDGLFATALMESGFAGAASAAYAAQLADDYGAAAGCARDPNTTAGGGFAARLACLRAAPLATLQAAAAAAVPKASKPFVSRSWGLTVDGSPAGIPEDPLAAVAAGRLNGGGARLLAGTNTDEGSVFIYPYYPGGMDAPAYEALISRMLAGSSARAANATTLAAVLARYPADAARQGADNSALAARAFGDFSFTCGTRLLLRAVAAQGGTSHDVRAFAYRFGQKAAADATPAAWGITHGSEVPFVFDQGSWAGVAGFTAAEEQLATAMGAAWTRFAGSGEPAGSEWPAFGTARQQEWLFVANASAAGPEPYHRSSECDFWDTIYPYV